jgi:hypothetical protein
MNALPISRRNALQALACGFGQIALAGLASQSTKADNSSVAAAAKYPARAKRIIFLFMQGGVSHVDSFDSEPKLRISEDGRMLDFADLRSLAKTGTQSAATVMRPLWNFAQHGKSGNWGSDLLKYAATWTSCVFIRSMHTEGIAHGPATLFLHTGTTTFVRPSMGAWISYGLGSENDNLPSFVTISPSLGNGGPRNYGSAFLPPVYTRHPHGRAGIPASEATIRNLQTRASPAEARRQFDLLREINSEQYAETR